MKASQIVAIGLVVGAVAWVASGHLMPHESAESRAAIRADAGQPKLFRVAVTETKLLPHSRKLTLSGRTEADKKVTITARTGGILTEMRAKRGQLVKKGEIIAVLSDDARVIVQGQDFVREGQNVVAVPAEVAVGAAR